ncbi:MAG: sugar transferase [Candidatus Scatosoma sp.]
MEKQCERKEKKTGSSCREAQRSRIKPEKRRERAQRTADLEESVALSVSAATKQPFGYNRDEEEPVGKIDPRKKYSDGFYESYLSAFQQNPKKRYVYRFIKRLFDFLVSLIALAVLSPLFLLIAIAIKCDSKGPVLFKQQRVGLRGKTFTCYKFRSMKITAPHDVATSVLEEPERYITRVGRVLRKFSLDELPQLFCSLIGTMSIIGYRPIVLSEKECNDMREKLGVFSFRPGLSGYAQVHGRDGVYYKNKAILDAEYVKNASVWLDLKLIFQTIAVVLTRKGNNSEEIDNREKIAKKEEEILREVAATENISTANVVLCDATVGSEYAAGAENVEEIAKQTGTQSHAV